MRRTTKICSACPGGPQELPLESFGINRATKDGRNVYCRACVCRRMSSYRVNYRERRQVLKKLQRARRPVRVAPVPERPAEQAVVVSVQRVCGLVLQAIDHAGGKASQRTILEYARARVPTSNYRNEVQNTIGEALCELFGERMIGTRGEAEGRVYFRRDFVRRF